LNTPPAGQGATYESIHETVERLRASGLNDALIATGLLGEGLFLRLIHQPDIEQIVEEVRETLGVIKGHIDEAE
jgi:hypothetical protein